MERINSAKFGALNRKEMGKLVGGTNTTTASKEGSIKLLDGSVVSWSADCVTTNENGKEVGRETYSYEKDGAIGWTAPCSIATR